MAAVVVEAVADDELVGDLEAGPVDLDGDVGLFLLQEDADFDVGGAEFLEPRDDAGEGGAGVEDVVDDEDVAATVGVAEGLEAAQLAGAFGAGVAGEADAVDLAVEIDGAQEVG